MRSRILIVLLGAIGDVVRGLPLAMRLRRGWPEARVLWAVEPASAPIVQGHPAVDEVVVFRRGEGAGALAPFLREVRALRADVALDLQRHFKSGLTTLASGAPRRIAFHWRDSREGNWFFSNEHIGPVERYSSKLHHYLRFADRLGVPQAPVEFGLGVSAEEKAHVQQLLEGVARPYAVFFVGASGPAKRWLPEPIAAVCRGLRERGLGVVLAGAGDEAELAERAIAAGAGDVVNLAGRTSLRDVVGLAAGARLAVSGDSGPMHIAAAVGTPVVGLFGATHPGRSAPYGFAQYVVRGAAPCAPCYLKHCPIGQLCMQSITPAAVLDKIDAALDTVDTMDRVDTMDTVDR